MYFTTASVAKDVAFLITHRFQVQTPQPIATRSQQDHNEIGTRRERYGIVGDDRKMLDWEVAF